MLASPCLYFILVKGWNHCIKDRTDATIQSQFAIMNDVWTFEIATRDLLCRCTMFFLKMALTLPQAIIYSNQLNSQYYTKHLTL